MAKAKDKTAALYGIGDHVWVPCRSTISKNGLLKSSDDQTSGSIQAVKITCDKIRYWPAKIISILFTGNRQLFSFIRVMSKDNFHSKTPSVTTRYLVKLVGLDINQEFIEQALISWNTFDPKPLPDVSISLNFNLFKKQLSDLSSYEIIALYVHSVRKVSKEIELAVRARDRDSITSVKNVKRIKTFHDEKGIQDSMKNMSQKNSRSKKGKKGASTCGKKSLPKKSLAKASSSVDSISKSLITETRSFHESKFDSNPSKEIPESNLFEDKFQKHSTNNYNDSNNHAIKTKFIKSIGYVTIDNNLFRTTRRGKVFGKWRPSKKSRLSEETSTNEKNESDDNSNQEVMDVSKHKNKENPCILHTTESNESHESDDCESITPCTLHTTESHESHESDDCESIMDIDKTEKEDTMKPEVVEQQQQADENSMSVFSSPLQSFRSAVLGLNIFSWSNKEKSSFLK
ncbi:10420_t:CDS:1 [Dentiscutata erythropus]|uniref:10420_t:CDS:1 n=1 Tax=Dentiscutata erythropus TaxID=1348616 RepID=A0A9N8WS60_9GLOM|nr:10420_t:CDS:1 [Dentiscutata erythropus]